MSEGFEEAIPLGRDERGNAPEGLASQRNRKLKAAFLTSVLSKFSSIIVLLFACPFAIQALGVKYGVYVAIAACVAPLSLANLGNGPGLTRLIVEAAARGDRERERKLFSNACLLIFFSVTAVVILFGVFQIPAVFSLIFGPTVTQGGDEARMGVLLISIFLPLTLIGGLGEVMYEGYREQSVTNTWSFVLSLLSIPCLFYVARVSATIPLMVFAISAPIAFTKLCGLGQLLFLRRPYLRFRLSDVDPGVMRAIVLNGIAFFLTATGSVLSSQMLVRVASQMGPVSAAQAGYLFVNLYTVGMVGVGMITVTIWPSLIDALTRGDHAWIGKAVRVTVLAIAGICIGSILVFGFGTGFLVTKLYRGSLPPDHGLYWLFGSYFAIYAIENAAIMLLIGLDRLRFAATAFVVRAIVLVAVAWPAMQAFGIPGLLGAGIATVALGSLPVLLPAIPRRVAEIKLTHSSPDRVEA